MKRITDFIVEQRNIILAVFVGLAGVALFLSGQVKINHDMTAYLPDDSETRQGMDIMEAEFEPEKTSELLVMVADLGESEKQQTRQYLENLEGVARVDYDASSDYNREDQTLYKLMIDDVDDSELAAQVYEEVETHFGAQERKFELGGAVAAQNAEVLPLWIVILAVGVALVILIVMSSSYVEPFLFLFTILIAILLNKGTNVIFPSVSNITDSITAILQLALSMDYSIMLMTRYTQEKKVEPDKVKAMKAALFNAFKSISSSSVTTVVGLIALVFMSFTIGRDLGLVLAKGVVFSLVAIFTCLPALILMFDRLIEKTQKRSPEVKFNHVGKAAYKLRYVGVGLFVLAFGASYLMKGNLGILYTDAEEDEISQVFPANNQMAIVYTNPSEAEMALLCKDQEHNEKVKQVLCYGNTIGEPMAVEDLNAKLTDLGSETQIADYLLGIVYYDYFAGDVEYRLTADEFVDFVQTEVMNNPATAEKIDAAMQANLTRLRNFTNPSLALAPRDAATLAEILETDVAQIQDLLIYYNARGNSLRLDIPEFMNFLTSYVLNSKYGDGFDVAARTKLQTVINLADRNLLLAELNSFQMANLLGLNQADIESLYLYNLTLTELNTRLTLAEWIEFTNNYVLNHPSYQGQLSEAARMSLAQLASLTNPAMMTREMTAAELASFLNLPLTNVQGIMMAKAQIEQQTVSAMSPYDFVNFAVKNADRLGLTTEGLAALSQAQYLMTSVMEGRGYAYAELAQIVGLDQTTMKQIYALYTLQYVGATMSPYDFVNFVLLHQNDTFLHGKMNPEVISSLQTLQQIMTGVVNWQNYSAIEMANLLGIEGEDVELLYSLYEMEILLKPVTPSLVEFTDFMIDDVMQHPKYASNVDIETGEQLVAVHNLLHDSLAKRTYAAGELTTVLSDFTDDLDENLMAVIYLYHGSKFDFNYQWRLTVEELINYVHDELLNDARFANFVDAEMRQEVASAHEMVADAKKMLVGEKHSRIILNTTYLAEGSETFDYIQNTKMKLDAVEGEHFMIGNSLMAYEMSQSFGGEMDMITILTMIFIFVVVAVTFKSMLIPAILVLLIQCAVYVTMGLMTISGGNVYFIALLIVQSILMGATIDYAILYTSYYVESRAQMSVKEAIVSSYNKSMHAIATSGLILILATLIVGKFSSGITAKICNTIAAGTTSAAILILVLLPAVLGAVDRLVIRKAKETK